MPKTDYSKLGLEVEFNQIDHQLNLLWEDDAASKASLINLVVYSERPEDLVENTGYVEEISSENACRAILVSAIRRSGKSPSIRSWITAHCRLTKAGQKSVCSEQVSFLLEGKTSASLRNVVFAKLESDLPLVFWWRGDLSGNFEKRLYSLFDRFVFDSAEWADPAAAIARLREARGRRLTRFVLHDLNRSRTVQLRLAVASCFDQPRALAVLPSMDSISVVHGKGYRSTALQFVVWMALHAGWEFIEGASGSATWKTASGKQLTTAFSESSAAEPISKVSMQFPQGSIEINREKGARFFHICTSLDSGNTEMVVPAECTDTSQLVIEQLTRGSNNSAFFESIDVYEKLMDV